MSLWKWAQCEQVSEAYSMIVTLASAGPSQTSPSGPGCSRAAVSADCASAPAMRRGIRTAAPRARPVVLRASRRVIMAGTGSVEAARARGVEV